MAFGKNLIAGVSVDFLFNYYFCPSFENGKQGYKIFEFFELSLIPKIFI